MGSALPVLSGAEVVRVFVSLDWEMVRQTGSVREFVAAI